MPRLFKEDAAVASLVLVLLPALMALDPATKAYVALATGYALFYLRWIIGPERRRSDHWFVQYGAMAAYYLPSPLVFYAASLVYSSGNESDGLIVHASLVSSFCFQHTFVMKAYSLSDSPLPGWRIIIWLICIPLLNWRFIWSERKLSILIYIFGSLFPLVFKAESPGASFADYVKAFSEYMKLEPFSDDDASSLHDRCVYPFTCTGGNIVTIKDLLQSGCTGDRDICLSFSFSQLLARRYFEFDCAEEGHPKVRDFALKELLQDPDHNRAFNIVEAQLAFLHDMFFTSYPSRLTTGSESVKQVIAQMLKDSALLAVIGLMAGLLFGGSPPYVDFFIGATAGVVGFLLFALPILYSVLPMYWLPIKHVLSSYPHTAPCSQASTNRERENYWRNKMGQYSLIEDYDRPSVKKTLIAWFKGHMLSKVSPIASFIKHHPAAEEDVSVPVNVRGYIATALRVLDGPPTNGTRSLNRVLDDLTWTCRQETHTDTILIWHIATCYCHMFLRRRTNPEYEVATTLSRYCAYLVAFIPELLPGSSFQTTITLQQVLQKARDLLGQTGMSTVLKRQRILELPLPDEVEARHTIFEKGIILGRQLEKLTSPWKVMAEFWVETTLYVAPSDNAAAHIERLAQGGEFVTHLWAMLSNAGILKRAPQPQPVVTSEGGAGSATPEQIVPLTADHRLLGLLLQLCQQLVGSQAPAISQSQLDDV